MPPVSTAEFHRDRVRAPHLEQPGHRERLLKAAALVETVCALEDRPLTLSDLGCGDGGLLSVVQGNPRITAWGYDFHPASREGWLERGVTATACDVFNGDRSQVRLGDIAVMTEVLEHLADPHGAVRWAATGSEWLVASSPAVENDVFHDACHAWAWDLDGYRALVEQAGFETVSQELVVADTTQIILARNRGERR